eukprot:TRINITY_DN4920_c0_g1_i1.p1 TRINITY_DN4920_c0_g1~~TRINITY_DN4920_c0_g1_i1.p1  ORF type:complete len:319 (+),score=59.39 TRINITY_DN4920_c0_g1_i1:38-994(+)
MGSSNSRYGSYITYAEHSLTGRRETMEDATISILNYADDDLSAFFGVFDGHSGSRCAHYVMEKLPTELLSHPTFHFDLNLALKETFLLLDKEFLREAQANKPPITDGSTGIVLVVRQNKLYVANTGDSRAVLCKSGEAVPLSKDHKPQDPVELERIEKNGGKILMGRVQGVLAVARSFGDLEYKNPDTLEPKFVTAEPDVLELDVDDSTEFVILACDGLWEKLSNEEAVNFVRTHLIVNREDIKFVVTQLVQLAFDNGSTDNISAIIVELNPKRLKLDNRARSVSLQDTEVPLSDTFESYITKQQSQKKRRCCTFRFQ